MRAKRILRIVSLVTVLALSGPALLTRTPQCPVPLPLHPISEAQDPSVKGFVEYHGDQRILNLWGTHYDMGYAHGYLLASEIVEMIEKYVVEERYDNDPTLYSDALTWVDAHYDFDAATYGTELQGLLDGMSDRGADLYIDVLAREANLLDLKLLNTLGAYGDEHETETHVEGSIEAFPATPDYVGTWTVSGQAFEANADTKISGKPAIGLDARAEVMVVPEWELPVATRIKILKAHATELQVEGPIESFPPVPGHRGIWTIAGQEFEADASTDVDDVPVLGRKVRVTAIHRGSEELPLATEIEAEEGCSSFSVWDGATAGGGTLAARNLDWRYDTREGIVATYGLLITYDPYDPQQNDFATVAWPGVIGAPTSFNAHGVFLTHNYGNGVRQYTGTDYVPLNLITRKAIETADDVDPVGDVLSVVQGSSRSGSAILLVAYPSSGSGQDGAEVIEYDAYGATIRQSDYDSPAYEHIIATNHFVERYTPNLPWLGSVARYDTIVDDLLSYYSSDDQVVDDSEAEQILKHALASTLHSAIARPDGGSYRIYFAKVTGYDPVDFAPAPYAPSALWWSNWVSPQDYTWQDLFPDGTNHGSQTPYAVLTHGPVVGGVTPSSARVFLRTSSAALVSIDFCTGPGMSGQCTQSASQPTSLDADYTAQVQLGNLEPSTTYYYDVQVDGASQLGEPYPQFTTFPESSGSVPFKVVVLSDVNTTYMHTPQVDTFASADGEDPDLVIIGGDFDHRNARSLPEKRQMFKALYTREDNYQDFVDHILRKYPVAHMWDDHDYGEENGDKTYPYKALSLRVLREYFPLYPTSDHGDWQKFTYGQAEFFMLDSRSQRDPNAAPDGPDKSMLDGDNLGSAGQLEWLRNGLLHSTATWKIVVSPSVFNPTSGKDDSWASFQDERQRILDFISDNDITGVVFVTGDMHFGAIDDGTNAGVPEMEVPSPNVIFSLTWTDTGSWSEGIYYSGHLTPSLGYGVLSFETDPDQVLLEVKDDQGQTRVSHVVSAEPSPAAAHISSIDMSLDKWRRYRRARADVLVVDQQGRPVGGAQVTGDWSGLTSGTSSETTSTDGTATLISDWTSQSGTFTFTVTDATASGYTYDPLANEETSDSVSW
jgi:alkaline phosphatase D